ncbi:endonuclease/exonuclease/phosphatase family protein [Streptomyces prunicolor]|uniref:endonuclease/exonuclease/phosphatase family protein n=1 Tax=Streptomyces prunicolor TaxID=67348 RepID=UPI00036DF382|nr:endonuclease/exonuclease/phosphatase family protein [Streptomyces prunicolor]
MSVDVIVAVSWNAEKNALGLAHEILRKYRPHIVFRQELTGAGADGGRALYAEANALGLFPFMASVHEGRSKNPVGVMIDLDLFEVVARTDHDLPWKPICHVQVRRKGLPRTLHLGSSHLCHFDPTLRAVEARRATTIADHNRTVLMGLDGNSYGHRRRDEISKRLRVRMIKDRVHVQHRTIKRFGRRVLDTRPSEILTGGRRPVFIDLGHYAGTVLGQRRALTPTASLRRTDQGPPQRIDWMLSTPDLVPALLSFEVIDDQDVRKRSDHGLTIGRFHGGRFDHVMSTPG